MNSNAKSYSGAATSAAKLNHRVGRKVRTRRVFCGGKWISWAEIHRDVARGYERFVNARGGLSPAHYGAYSL